MPFDFNIFLTVAVAGVAYAVIAWYVIMRTEKAIENYKAYIDAIAKTRLKIEKVEQEVAELNIRVDALRADLQIAKEMMEKGKKMIDRRYKL